MILVAATLELRPVLPSFEAASQEPSRVPSLLVAEDGLHPCLKRLRQRSKALIVIEISNVAQVAKIKRDVMFALRDYNYFAAERVSDPGLVEHVRVSTREIANDDAGSIDEVHHVLNNARCFPYLVSASR